MVTQVTKVTHTYVFDHWVSSHPQRDVEQSFLLSRIKLIFFELASMMDYSTTEDLDKPGLFKEGREQKGTKKSQEKSSRKIQLRFVTNEMLEIYQRMSEEEEKFKQQYEEAAFMVYGTLPKGKVSFDVQLKMSEIHKN